ncbi:D-alanyl-D-alanine carboxypeptidase/D-alanyl-D-alanine endopeptidase [Streptomyces sp. MAR4 CNX-425]|uniref:D-alanyl-D-alanine carboxypeptidase/D-alanyl-D-alanine endopeptidase n=1 Tax=Streptomyces sp. MAR4 CNX-425 TaxID=3406343 RepID=UPI003B5131CC
MSRSPGSPKSAARTWTWPAAAAMAALLAVGLGGGAPAGAEPGDDGLKQALDNVLADERLEGALASVVVADAASGETLYEHSAATRLMPASNTKLPTSAAAMELLGPGYTWSTDVLAAGDDLYLRGTGDPTMLAADYDALAAKVAAAGVDEVDRLVADDTRFDDVRLGNGWSADYESDYYAMQISALTVAPDTDYDAGTVVVEAYPGKRPGDRPRVEVTPPTGYVEIENHGRTVAKGEADTLRIAREHGTNTIVVSGNIPVKANATKEWITVWEPTGYAAAVFRDALERHGVEVEGRSLLGRATPDRARPVASHSSMPLKDLLIPFMKLSNNGHAEILTKTIGVETADAGTWPAGLRGISSYLESVGVDTSTLRQVDGSGLSRGNNIPGRAFVQLLTAVQDEPWFGAWYESLPVACDPERFVGGTLRSRMCDTPAEGNARAKTGSLTGASALSGYVTAADGRELVFSVVLNNYLAGSVKDIEDDVVTTLAGYGTESQTAKTAEPRSPKNRNAERGADVECAWLKPRGC